MYVQYTLYPNNKCIITCIKRISHAFRPEHFLFHTKASLFYLFSYFTPDYLGGASGDSDGGNPKRGNRA